jgi:hypothetical protein
MFTKSIYITGAIQNQGIDQLVEFAEAKERAEDLGFTMVMTAADLLPEANKRAGSDSEAFFLAAREQFRKDADITLWLNTDDVDSYQEVRRSRTEGKIVRSFRDFIEADAHRLEPMLTK